MDINKIQKLNQMAVNLQKHNIVLDKNSAIENAEKIYGMENNFSKNEVVNMTDDVSDEMRKDVRKMAFALRDAINEITELKTQMKKMQSEFNNLIVNQRPSNPRPYTQQTAQQSAQQLEASYQLRQEAPHPAAQATLTNSEHKITRPIDRNNVAPSEISIEKMFYCGQK